jgi:ATPase subunit of ABC transporter with duplicated ATPase domains
MQEAGAALLEVSALTAGYARPVVGPISLEIRARQVVGIRGPNGSGKSTVLRAIGGAARIFSGTVSRQTGLRIAHQHQNPLPLEDVPLSGRDLLRLTRASAYGLPPWIEPLLDQRLDRLSGGQLQLLQVWACLKAPVDLVLLDEPTNNVDRAGVEFLERTLLQRETRPAVLLISHDHRFLKSVCDEIVELGL